jgi:hypothetical protein
MEIACVHRGNVGRKGSAGRWGGGTGRGVGGVGATRLELRHSRLWRKLMPMMMAPWDIILSMLRSANSMRWVKGGGEAVVVAQQGIFGDAELKLKDIEKLSFDSAHVPLTEHAGAEGPMYVLKCGVVQVL